MSTELVVILVVAGWLGFGPALSMLMGRRGHSAAAWGVTGMFLGPLAVPLAVDAASRRHQARVAVLHEEAAGGGPLSVLAGIDGSDEARAALVRAVGLLGDRIGRLTLVHVANVDAADDEVLMDREVAAARVWMAAVRLDLGDRPATECIVAGRPAPTLVRLGTEGGYDLLVVGSRGHGMTPRLLGSVVRDLAGSSPLPVLIGGVPSLPGGIGSEASPGTVEIDLATR